MEKQKEEMMMASARAMVINVKEAVECMTGDPAILAVVFDAMGTEFKKEAQRLREGGGDEER